ncbi:hypothetical protein IHE44_0007244, partial [Lamprotornis superbus]
EEKHKKPPFHLGSHLLPVRGRRPAMLGTAGPPGRCLGPLDTGWPGRDGHQEPPGSTAGWPGRDGHQEPPGSTAGDSRAAKGPTFMEPTP